VGRAAPTMRGPPERSWPTERSGRADAGKDGRMDGHETVDRGRERADSAKKVILFVCRANVCRSPMAEALFNALAEEGGLGYRAESAGVAALVGEDVTPKARAALEEVGIHADSHRARQVNGEMLEEADLVLAMSPRQVAILRRDFGGSSGKVHALPAYAVGAPDEEGVPDPYGQTMTAFRASLRQLLGHVERVVERLGREEDPR
jgi:protein-tyrosine phosphatase